MHPRRPDANRMLMFSCRLLAHESAIARCHHEPSAHLCVLLTRCPFHRSPVAYGSHGHSNANAAL